MPSPSLEAPMASPAALALGVPRRQLYGPAWRSPWRGVRVPTAVAISPDVRARAAAVLLPDGGALGGWAAAHLLGAEEIDGLADDGSTRLPVPLYPGHRLRPRAGIELWRSALAPGDVVDIGGVVVTSPVRTAFDLGRRGPDVRDAVVAIDQALRCLRIDAAEVGEYASRRPRWHGAPLVRQALPLVNARARSRPETRLRLVWKLDAGLPTPMVNPEVRVGGRLLGLADLLDPCTGLVAEYDGAQHRELEQHTSDNIREEGFERAALTVVRATSRDMGRRLLVTRLQAAHDDASCTARGAWTAEERPLRG